MMVVDQNVYQFTANVTLFKGKKNATKKRKQVNSRTRVPIKTSNALDLGSSDALGIRRKGVQTSGCHNPYKKHSGAFLADYRALIDFMKEAGFNSVIAWGFLRDSHGGEHDAHRLCEYAAKTIEWETCR